MRRDGATLPTDRLLNAIYLATSALPGSDDDHRRVARALFDASGQDGS